MGPRERVLLIPINSARVINIDRIGEKTRVEDMIVEEMK
jgi:hypothetical protein